MLRVQTLGQSVIDAGKHRYTPSSIRPFALLLYLAAERGRRVPRAVLQAMIFPDYSDQSASHSLRQLLYRLRQHGVSIESTVDDIVLDAHGVQLDYVDLFSGDRLSAEQIAAIEGGFLPDLSSGALSESYLDWLDGLRSRTTLELRRVLVRELNRAKSVCDWRTLERAARACLVLDPMNDEAHFGVAESLAAVGSKAEAMQVIDCYLAELGPGATDLRIPATMLRRRISERKAVPYRVHPELPFVGRDDEVLLLGDRFQRARGGDSQCVVLHGEAGIGKSRLAAEFATLASLEGARVVRVAAQPHDVHRPMGAFADLVPLLLELPGALGCSPESMAALKRLTTHGSPGPSSEQDRDSESVFYSITTAISDLVDAISNEGPIVAIVEDLHWFDAMSIRVLADLLSAKRQQRVLVVATSRDPSHLSVNARYADRLTSVALTGIRPEIALELASAALATSPRKADDELRAWVASTAGGNPLFLGSLAFHYVATGERLVIPPTLSSLLRHRIEVLPRRARTILHACIILGKYCTVSRLAAALDLPTVDVFEGMQDLELARLIEGGQQDNVGVVHSLIAQGALNESAGMALQVLRRKIAGILDEESRATRSAAQLWDCAEMWIVSGDFRRAVDALKTCAEHAIEIGRPREAAELLIRAFELSDDPTERTAVLREAILAADVASEPYLIFDNLVRLRELQPDITHDQVEIAELRALYQTGRHGEETLVRLLGCVHSDAPPEHRVRAGKLLNMLADEMDRSDAALDAHPVLIAEIGKLPADSRDSLEYLLVFNSAFGNLDESARIARLLLSLASTIGPASAMQFSSNAAWVLARAGYTNEAIAGFEAAYQYASKANLRRSRMLMATYVSGLLFDLDNAAGLKLWFDRASEIAQEFATLDAVPHWATLNAYFALCDGRVDAAEDWCDRLGACLDPNTRNYTTLFVTAARLRCRQMRHNHDLSAAEFSELLQFARAARFDGCDLAMEVIYYHMVAQGESSKAASQLRHYVETRRAKTPLARTLRHIAESVQNSDP